MKTMLGSLLAASLLVGLVSRQIAIPGRPTPIPGSQAMEAHVGVVAREHRTAGGVRLHFRVVPPARRGMRYSYRRQDNRFSFSFDWTAQTPASLAPRGSIVYLHGWSNDGQSMLPWALALADAGWKGVVVDLRGHGGSQDAPVGYGSREAGDVADLVAALEAAGELPQPVFLLGNSYGATSALFAEPALRGRITGIVALQPFATAEGAIRGFVELVRESDVSSLRERWERGMLRRADLGEAIDAASTRLAIDLREVDVRPLVAASRTCLLDRKSVV